MLQQLAVSVIVIALCLIISPVEAVPKGDFYVATNGNDTWSGKLATPNKKGTDGPFSTSYRAQKAVRTLLTQNAKHGVTVLIRDGVYYMNEPLTFNPEDSGAEKAQVVYAAYPGEKPVLSGGQRITGWRQNADGRWTVTLPDVKSGEWNFMQLFVNDQRRYRPRLPKNGYYSVAGEVKPSDSAVGRGIDAIQFNAADIKGDWSNISDVEVLPFHIWGMGRFRIKSVSEADNIVKFTGTTPSLEWWGTIPKGNRFLVENVREALDSPGEWYLDRKTGVLTYIPMPGEDPSSVEVIAPRIEQLFVLKGDVDSRKWVEHITLRGLTFAHANYVTPASGHDVPQAEADLPAAVFAEGARNCVVENCRVTHVGAYCLELGAGCRNNRIDNCELTDLGAGGVKLGEQRVSGDEEEVAQANTVTNCLIANGGRLHPAGIGVWIAESHDNQVTHNEITDFYYTGVSEGWTWGYGPSNARNNNIAYNHIHKIGQGVLSDMGGIYTLGSRPTTLLDHNMIHDVDSFSYGGWGIYFDEGSTGVLATNNIVYNTKSAGFHQHYGKENFVRNNIFAFGREAQLMRTRPEEHLSFTLERNLVLAKDAPMLGSNWSGSNYKLDNNIYWNTDGSPVKLDNLDLTGWQAKGQDTHSLVADPGFIAPEKGDFRLKPGSPAVKIGFQPIDMKGVGRPGKPNIRKDVPAAFPIIVR